MKSSVTSLALGAVMIIFGIVALMNPFAATLTAEQMLGWVFLFAGILQFFAVFRGETWGQKIWALLLASVNTWLGISLLGNPLAGILALTYVVAIMFAVSGATKIILSFSVRDSGYFWPVLLSGVISLVLALMVISNFPQSAVTLLGVLLAVELLSSGVTLIVMGLSPKAAEQGKS